VTRAVRVVIATQNAPVYLGGFVRDFLDLAQKADIEIQGFLVLPPLFHRTAWLEAKARLDLYGVRDFMAMCGHIVWSRFQDTLFKCGWRECEPRLLTLLKDRNLRLLPYGDVNSTELADYLKDQVDVLVSIACPKIIKKNILEAPRLGALNYHTGALPKYRGRQPLYWALKNGEPFVGVTVHEMVPQLDGGPILEQVLVDIHGVKTLHECYRRTLKVGPELIVKAIQSLASGDTQRLPNQSLGERPHRFPSKEDGREFRKKGLRVY
jgi:hypothetical protein